MLERLKGKWRDLFPRKREPPLPARGKEASGQSPFNDQTRILLETQYGARGVEGYEKAVREALQGGQAACDVDPKKE